MKKRIGLGLGVIATLTILGFFISPETAHEYYEVDEQYQAQVDAYYVPPMPTDWSWKEFKTKDGTQLRWGETGNRNAAKASLIIVPGYTASVSMYGEHADKLAEQGYHVIGLDLRGQGGSQRYRAEQPEKLWANDFATYSDDLASFIRAQNLPKDRVVVPVAMSFGGHVATRMAVENTRLVDGLFLLAPAFVPKAGDVEFDKALFVMKMASRLGKGHHYVLDNGNWKPASLDLTQANIDMCSSEPKRLHMRDVIFTREPHQRVGGVTNKWGAEFFKSSQVIMDDGYLSQLQIPVSIISAEKDDFVDTKANQLACSDEIAMCKDIQIPGTGHCLMQEHDEDLAIIFAQIDRLVSQVLGG
ncbi:MAG: alpha/beta hydrolase [Litorimonas sp.]